jgi:hypothetical protein
MIICYLNYPNPEVKIHLINGCHHIKKHNPNSRELQISSANLSMVIQDFERRKIDFAAKAGSNDLYLEIDFDNYQFEKAVLHYLVHLLSKRYSPFEISPQECSSCF